uniref:SUMO-activating enzyme subunit 1 n=1 Tax=Culicoides sonorensis TaxID=179676 RepID=A0A336K9T0_CULSO
MKSTVETELTEQEAELYDRQIRLWGLESQKRLRSARILIAGLNGAGAEVAKNIILSGVKSVTLLDDKLVTELDFCSQFFVPQNALGKNRAEASEKRAQALNPMVEVKVDIGNFANMSDEYFKDFDVVCISEGKIEDLVRVDNICRAANVKFFAFDLWGMFGYSFADLKEHEFAIELMKHKIISEPNKKTKTELVAHNTMKTQTYCSLSDALSVDLAKFMTPRHLKRVGNGYPMLKILQKFRDENGRDPLPASRDEDTKKLLTIRDGIAPNIVGDEAFEHVFAQISPAAAVLGGQVAQEVIKTVSQKEAPLHNVFIFDPEKSCGYIELVQPVA